MSLFDDDPELKKQWQSTDGIDVAGGKLATATSLSLAKLGAEENPMQAVYRSGSLLVRPVCLQSKLKDHGIRRPNNALVLKPVSIDWMRLRLSQIAQFYVEKGDNKDIKYLNPPIDVCKSVLAASPWSELPELSGVIEAPIILPDGTIVQKEGYDASTGLLFVPGATKFEKIPEAPTLENAQEALRIFKEPFKEFPFIDEAARSTAMCTSLTALVRRALPSAPITGYDAPKMASGKTLLSYLPSYIATGRSPTLISHTADVESERKRLLALLLEGPTSVVIDNITGFLKSDALSSILTEPAFTDRLLGSTSTATAPTNVVFGANGNNLRFAGDLSSRSLIARLEPNIEKPEERIFERNLHIWVPEHRGRIAVAGLTIIKWYLNKGAPIPSNSPNFARFEEWQRLCRYPLVCLGCTDPYKTRERIEVSDPVREDLIALSTSWHEKFGSVGTTAKDAVAFADDGTALHDAMLSIGSDKGKINTRRVGNFISAHMGRWEHGFRFVARGTSQHRTLWKVEQMATTAGGNEDTCESDEFRGSDSPRSISNSSTHNFSHGDGKQTHQTHQTHQSENEGERPFRGRI